MLYKEKSLAAAVSEALLFNALGPRNDGTIDIEPILGIGSATFARNDVAYQRDFENNYNLVPAGEARFQGARRVENKAIASEDFTNVTYWGGSTVTVVGGVTDKNGGDTASTVTATSANQILKHANIVAVDESNATTSIWIKRRTGSGVINMIKPDGSAYTGVNVTNEWKRFTISKILNSTILYLWVQIVTDGDEIDVCFSQAEDVSGQTITAPSEYIPTTLTTAITKYYWTTNENTVASNVVTEIDGLPLHPTVRKENGRGSFSKFQQKIIGSDILARGAQVFERFAKRVNSTAYTVNNRFIPATGSGPAGGNGFYYIVTAITTGTSDSSPPVFPTTIGDTVVDGGITIKNAGYYTVAGYLGEPTRTNSILQSRQFDTTWANSGTIQTQDQNGIDGVANTAWQIEDNSGAAPEDIRQSVTVADNSEVNCFSIFILKDSNTTRFPEVFMQYTGGTTQFIITQINTQTGEHTDRLSSGTTTSEVEDRGLWWKLILTCANNGTGNTGIDFILFPARALTLGGADNSAVGTTIFDQAQLELNAAIPSSPIETTTVAVERLADDLHYDDSNYQDNAGSTIISEVLQHNANQYSTEGLLTTKGTSEGMLYHQVNVMSVFDGSTGVQASLSGKVINDNLINAVRWSAALSKFQPINTQTTGIDTAYDGSWQNVSNQLEVFKGITSPKVVSDIRIYKRDLGTTKLEALTEYD